MANNNSSTTHNIKTSKSDDSIMRKSSIKTKILIIPLIIILVGVIVMGGISSYVARENLLNEMKSSGLARLEQLESRVNDNVMAVENINESLTDKIRMTGNTIVRNQLSLSSGFLRNLATDGDIVE